MEKFGKNKTIMQCESCENMIISSIDELPNVCPYCKKESNFSIVSLNINDMKKIYEYVQKT